MTAKRRGLAGRRKAVGCTQEQLAALLGVERSTVVRWEAGETEPLPWCRPKLAEALAVSLEVLDGLLTSPDGLPVQPHDEFLLSLLGNLTSAEIGTLMERFTAVDIASRREVLAGSFHHIRRHPVAAGSSLIGTGLGCCPAGHPRVREQ
ncbi:MAG: helix-turn-helix domain-containing protein [Actinomycetota bacterium]|nr:helix-turn-helix domain-containing protein [Actinomycetota bacterium]